jgi:diguanylate cyclase (GGDEF)-like protein/PAS domain S-box-containing protein
VKLDRRKRGLKLFGVEEPIYVLVVDDDEADAMLVEETLDDAGRRKFKVDIVTTYDAALRMIPEGDYDVVLLDHQLGARTGVELLHELRRHSGLPPVIMLTGADPETADREALSAGASDLVTKGEAMSVPGLLERAIIYALERLQQRRALSESEERYAVAVAGSTDGIWDWDPSTAALHASKRFREILGLSPNDPLDIHVWRARIEPRHLEGFDQALQAHLDGQTSFFTHEHLVIGNAVHRWVRVRGVAVRDKQGRPRRMAGSLTDVHSEKMAQDQILHAATHDQLTGVHNRTFLQDTIDKHLKEVRRNPAHAFSLLYVDLDRFKPLNDGLGHLTGDEIIFETARRLRVATEGRGVVARHGGDEFVVVLSTSERETLDVAESLQRAFRHPFDLNGGGRRIITASIGVVHGRPSYREPSEMIRDADIAMFRAKQQGRDGVVVFDDEMREEALRRFNLEHDLPEALAEGHVNLLYQPIVSLETGRAVGVETLIRWMHPTYGAVPPPEFVGIAEETGMIVKLGEYVLAQVVRDIKGWPHTDVAVSINVSPIELSDSGLVDRFRRALQGLPENAINIEITETAVVQNEHKVAKLLGELRDLGVRAHLDDFGTGFASVSHLVMLPLEGVKIDMSLVRRIQDPRYQSTVRAIVDLAHGLGMYTVVEGIETGRQRDIVKSLDADFAQGYLFARPMSAEHIGKWLSANPSG